MATFLLWLIRVKVQPLQSKGEGGKQDLMMAVCMDIFL